MTPNDEVLTRILPHRPNRNIFEFFIYILQRHHYKSIEMTHFYIGNLLQTTQILHFSHFFWPWRPPFRPSQRSEREKLVFETGVSESGQKKRVDWMRQARAAMLEAKVSINDALRVTFWAAATARIVN